MSSPSFSICIPNFNYGHYIGDTIRSVLRQTHQDFEIIVTDNASTDQSVDIVASFDDPRIRLIRNRCNIGFAPNLQRATMFARNEFINLLSSDDLMRPDALERYAEAIVDQGGRRERTVLVSDAEVIDGQGRPSGEKLEALDGIDPTTFASRRLAAEETVRGGGARDVFRGKEVLGRVLRRLRTFAPFLTVVYHRSLWDAVEGYNAVRTIGPDKFFHYKLLALDPDVVYVHRPLFGYRTHASPNAVDQRSTLKQQADDYLYTIEYPDPFLADLGIRREELVRAFLDRVCLKAGLAHLASGYYTPAFQSWAFSLASYPAMALRRPRFYALAGLLATGPLARHVATLLRNLYGRRPANGHRGGC
jgi:glycosyltransferase involved in cell wall biosynthesis